MRYILIIGKTSSGKDTIAKYLKYKFGVKPLVSYTTRPMRDGETDGVEHYFISKEEMKEMVDNEFESMIAYTQFPKTGYEYCALDPDPEGIKDGCLSYIINPEGIDWMQLNYKGNNKFFSVYVDCDEDTIRRRALNRGDGVKAIEDRLDSEREQFDKYKKSGKYNFLFDNNGEKYGESMERLIAAIKEFFQ